MDESTGKKLMWKCTDVKMYWCENVKKNWWENVEKCEKMLIWKNENELICKCAEVLTLLQTPTKLKMNNHCKITGN